MEAEAAIKLPDLRKGFFRGVWPFPGVDELLAKYRDADSNLPEWIQWIVLPLKEFIEFLPSTGWQKGMKVPDFVAYDGIYVCWKQSAKGLCWIGKDG